MDTLAARYADEFPVKGEYAYLNHAGVSPLSLRAANAAEGVLQRQLLHGAADYSPWTEGLDRARAALGVLCGADPDDLAFAKNTTHGLLLAAGAIPWREGDNVVAALGEFPANIHPWLGLEPRGVATRLIAPRQGRVLVDDLAAAMDARTRALAVSWVQFSSGYRSDLTALSQLCRERGAYLVVDAIQGLGALRLNLRALGVDFLCADGHKWLLSVEGCAVLYVNRDRIGELAPGQIGWMGMKRPFDFLDYEYRPRDDARRYEEGSHNVVGIHALGAAAELLVEAGPERVERAVLSLTDDLAERLRAIGCEVTSPREEGEKSGIVMLTHPRASAEELAARLNAQRIICVERAGALRFSPHFYNDTGEVERAVAAVAECVGR